VSVQLTSLRHLLIGAKGRSFVRDDVGMPICWHQYYKKLINDKKN